MPTTATLATVRTGPVTADDVAPGCSMVINGHVVLVAAVDYRLADATIHVVGSEGGGMVRDFRLASDFPVIVL